MFFIIFFSNTFQIFFDEGTGTLTITSSEEITDEYSDNAIHIIIEEVSAIPAYSFEAWPSLVTARIGNSVKTIGICAFGSCPYLETVHIGANVTTISIWAFSSCSSLKCIYFYGESSPYFLSSGFGPPFYEVPATSVMVLSTYQNDTFGHLSIS